VRRTIGVFAAALFLVHLTTDNHYDYFRDELYFIDCAHHLDWGYVDFAPLTIWILRAIEILFGDSLHAIRLLPALAAAIKVILTALIAIEFDADGFGIAIACLCVVAAPVYLVVDHQFGANAFEPLFWMGIAYLLIRTIRFDSPQLLAGCGLLAGLGIENKITMLFFLATIVAGCVMSPARGLLLTRWTALAILLAVICFLPTLLWQYHRDWPTLQMFENVRRLHKNADLSGADFIWRQAMMLNVGSAAVWIAGLWFLLREARWRAFGYAYLVLLAILIAVGAKDYYLAPIHPLLFAAGGASLSRYFLGGGAGWTKYALSFVTVAGGLVAAPLALPLLSPAELIRYQAMLRINQPRNQTGQEGPLPEHFGDEFGWREMAATTARVYHGLPPDERGHAAILTKNYGEAGAIDFFGPPLGLPPAISGHQNYWLWGPRGYAGDVIIALQFSRDELLRMGCASIEDGPTVAHPYAMAEEHFRLEICRGIRPALAAQWPSLKRWY